MLQNYYNIFNATKNQWKNDIIPELSQVQKLKELKELKPIASLLEFFCWSFSHKTYGFNFFNSFYSLTSFICETLVNTKKYHDFFCYFIRLHYLCSIKYNTI